MYELYADTEVAFSEEQQVQEMEKEMRMQQSANEVGPLYP